MEKKKKIQQTSKKGLAQILLYCISPKNKKQKILKVLKTQLQYSSSQATGKCLKTQQDRAHQTGSKLNYWCIKHTEIDIILCHGSWYIATCDKSPPLHKNRPPEPFLLFHGLTIETFKDKHCQNKHCCYCKALLHHNKWFALY